MPNTEEELSRLTPEQRTAVILAADKEVDGFLNSGANIADTGYKNPDAFRNAIIRRIASSDESIAAAVESLPAAKRGLSSAYNGESSTHSDGVDSAVPGQPVHEAHTGNALSAASKSAAAAHVATGAVGMTLGTVSLVNSIEQGDTGGAVIAGTNVASGAAHSGVQILESVGKTVAPGLKGVLAKGNVAVTIADGAYQVFNEDGIAHKLQRTASVIGTTGASTVAGTALTGGLTVSGVAATGATAAVTTVAAPLVAAGAAGYVVGAEINGAIETSRIYENAFDVQADLKNHANLLPFAAEGYHLTKDSPHLKNATRDARGYVDLNNPENFEKLRLSITDASEKQQKIMNANEPSLPMWAGVLPFTDTEGRTKYADAKVKVAFADSALKELDDIEKQMRESLKTSRENEMHLTQSLSEKSPKTTALGMNQDKPKTAQAEKSLSSLSDDVLKQAVASVSKGTTKFHEVAAQADRADTNKVAIVLNEKGASQHIG